MAPGAKLFPCTISRALTHQREARTCRGAEHPQGHLCNVGKYRPSSIRGVYRQEQERSGGHPGTVVAVNTPDPQFQGSRRGHRQVPSSALCPLTLALVRSVPKLPWVSPASSEKREVDSRPCASCLHCQEASLPPTCPGKAALGRPGQGHCWPPACAWVGGRGASWAPKSWLQLLSARADFRTICNDETCFPLSLCKAFSLLGN